jgi:hypothetical protein
MGQYGIKGHELNNAKAIPFRITKTIGHMLNIVKGEKIVIDDKVCVISSITKVKMVGNGVEVVGKCREI